MVLCWSITSSLIMLLMFCGEEEVGVLDRPSRLSREVGMWLMVMVMEVRMKTTPRRSGWKKKVDRDALLVFLLGEKGWREFS